MLHLTIIMSCLLFRGQTWIVSYLNRYPATFLQNYSDVLKSEIIEVSMLDNPQGVFRKYTLADIW